MSKTSTTTDLNSLIIPAAQDFFFDKTIAWLRKHESKIKHGAQTNSWWQRYALVIDKGEKLKPTHLLRQLTEMGYEKVQTPLKPGEYAVLGDTIQLIPFVMAESFYSISFFGNVIDELGIKPLTQLPTKQEIEQSFRAKVSQTLLNDLQKNDYIVHLDHGIGRFVERLELDGEHFFKLSYAKGDTLLVPEKLKDKLSAYVGFSRPHIHRLGGELWFNTKRKVRKEVEEMARQLLDLYAKREITTRQRYTDTDEIERVFASSFPYQETVDQHSAINDILKDLSKVDRPMDRILTGDVGFGKTEVTLRAAMKVIASGGQVAFLAPTTVLADQHYRRISERFAETGIRVGIITRVKNDKDLLKDLHNGDIDMLIGTHRLLSKDVEWKKLRLAIIDEEQKFGVQHKEHFKEMRGNIDMLSVTATPIPRTLYLALSGLRPVSSLHTPPVEKQSIHTAVHPYDAPTIKQALQFELGRDGQVYYLFNRIKGIREKEAALQKLMPKARIRVAHARMNPEVLLKTLEDFENKKFDILLATTIIENGLDLPNVNTLIVESAERLGLTQMHQIRGRVGRKGEKAYAYFFYNDSLTDDAQKRLEYLERYQALGDGYKLALKDLEIRGAGNILGKNQSGPINAVGLNLYSQMLSDAVEQMKRGQ